MFFIILLILIIINSLAFFSSSSSSNNRNGDRDYVKPPNSNDWSNSREDESFNCGEDYEDCDCDCDCDCDDCD